MVRVGVLTDAIATNAYKTGVQEGWYAIYKIKDDEAFDRVPPQEDTAYWGQYAPQRERERTRKNTQSPEQGTRKKPGTTSRVNWTWWLLTRAGSSSLIVPLAGWQKHHGSSLTSHWSPHVTSTPGMVLFYWSRNPHGDPLVLTFGGSISVAQTVNVKNHTKILTSKSSLQKALSCQWNHERFIPLHQMTEKLGSDVCKALPEAHALTGCDSISACHQLGMWSMFTTCLRLAFFAFTYWEIQHS